MQNKVLPDRIVIVISSYEANNTPQMYKDNPLIELIYIDIDLKPHNKYYWTALKYPNAVIITIDDDVIYPPTFIEDCINSYNNSPNTVNACRVHKIKYNEHGILPYRQWEWESKDTEPSFDLFFTGVGGVVYPPNFFKEEDLDINEVQKYIKTDDIFLNYLCRKQKIKIKRIPIQNEYKDIHIIPFKPMLCRINVGYNNDVCLNSIGFNELLKKCKQ